jgi:hypothetical protein
VAQRDRYVPAHGQGKLLLHDPIADERRRDHAAH